MAKNKFRPALFAVPWGVISALFVVFPLVLVFVYAFIGEDGRFTFGNFVSVFTEISNLTLLLKTIGISLLATVICLLIAYPTALILASSPFNRYVVFALLFIIPMWMNFVLRVIAMRSLLYIFHISNGLLATMIGMVYDFLPFMLLPIYTVLVNMDKSYLEASADLGGNTVVTFFKVTLPLSAGGIISGATMVFMPVFSAYAITGMLGDARTNVFGARINALFSNSSTWGVGSALSFILLILVILTMVLSSLVTGRAPKEKAADDKGGAQ